MGLLRITIRLLLLGVHIIAGTLLCVFALPADWNQSNLSRPRNIVRWWLATCVRLIGIRTCTRGTPTEGPSLIVANHISWMDIVIIGSLQPVSFLSKSEIAHWPVIGYLARKAGTLFIEQGKGAANVAHSISQRLYTGSSVAFFPEGHASDGTRVNRFHARLFMSVTEARVPVQPVFVTYPDKGSRNGINPKAPYIRGSKSFFVHALTLIAEPHINAVIDYTVPILEHDSRNQLAQKAQEQIAARHRATIVEPVDTVDAIKFENQERS